MNFSGIQFTPLCFGCFNAILSLRVSFLFLLVFVLLVKGKGPRSSDGEFDSYAIHACMCDITSGRGFILVLSSG